MDTQEQQLPRRLSLQHKPNESLHIVYRWFREIHLFILFFSFLWNALLLFFYLNADSLSEAPVTFLIFPLLHLLTGLALFYYALAGIFNKTLVIARASHLSIRHRPFPWIGGRRIPRTKLAQLFVHESISHSSSGTLVTYQVRALVAKRKQAITLVRGLESPEQARFIERSIEDYLQIQDYPVSGEYPKENTAT